MRKRVLLVDQDQAELNIFISIFSSFKGSLKCDIAGSGGQALELIRKKSPDFVFVDHELNDINALQLLSAIRFEARLRKSKVFLYAKNISIETSKMARMLGASGCIERTDDLNTLSHQLTAILAEELLPPYSFLKSY